MADCEPLTDKRYELAMYASDAAKAFFYLGCVFLALGQTTRLAIIHDSTRTPMVKLFCRGKKCYDVILLFYV